ncbi:MAG: hypothetical protein J6R77_06405, partial [Clostridia bacterium]|nr:hypothetical protein [Clostridia bacterium]
GLMRVWGGQLTTGWVGADGVQHWNSEALPVAALHVLRVPFDVERLPGWNGGEGDGTILFIGDGDVVAPLKAGGYRSLRDYLYVPRLLVGGVGAADLLDPPPVSDVWEERNRLTAAFRASYTTDGSGRLFYLPVKGVDDDHPITAVYTNQNGQEITHTIAAGAVREAEKKADGLRMVYQGTRACVYFENESGEMTAPAAAGISDNLTVTAHADSAAPKEIGQMRFGCWFGGESGGLFGGTRLFLGGDPHHPERICWSAAENPLYFPESQYVSVGEPGGAVTAFGKQGNMLVIFKERELYAATYESPAEGLPAGACVSVYPLHSEIGCDCPHTVRLCQNRLVWLHSSGQVYTLVAGNAYSGSNVRPLSALIEPELKSAPSWNLQKASAACYEGWYLLLVGRRIWLFRYDDTAFQRIGSYATAEEQVQKGMIWHMWEGNLWLSAERLVSCAEDVVLFDSSGRSYLLGGLRDTVVVDGEVQEEPIECSLSTALLDLGHSDVQKTVRELCWQVGLAEDGELTFTYVTDRGEQTECRSFHGTAHSPRTAEFWKSLRLTPHAVRVHRFGWRLSATGAVKLGPVSVRYDVENRTERGGGWR